MASIQETLDERANDKFDLHERYLNPKLVRLLKTIGFDRHYVRASGQYLFDGSGERYLDLLSGFGVFALGRNHPGVKRALIDVLNADLPDLVQMDVSPLAGLLAEALIRRMNGQERVFFCNSGTEAVEMLRQ
jgi:ornithine--oxo-acid transaminase